MDGPSRGTPPPPPLAGSFPLPSRDNPLVTPEELSLWARGSWLPTRLPVAKRREARYGLRGVRLGEARIPGPSSRPLIWVFLFLLIHVTVAPRPSRVRGDKSTPLCDTVVDQAFHNRKIYARTIMCTQFLSNMGLPTWDKLACADHKECNQVLMAGMPQSTMSTRFASVISALGIPKGKYTVGGLRPGGATWEYLNHMPIPTLKFRGRWAAEGSLEHYIQECTAYLDFDELEPEVQQRIASLESKANKLLPLVVDLVK